MSLYTTKQGFIEAIAPAAVSVGTKYHYLPSVLIAQACLENGYGMDKSCEILIDHNNLLGIKAELLNKSWADKTVWDGTKFLKNTPEYYGGKYVRIDDYFRAYKSYEQCLEDYCLFMTYAAYSVGGKPKYRDSVIGVSDPEKLITAVTRLGYATDHNYSKSVMRIINEHNLTKYDELKGHNEMVKKLENRNIKDITKQNLSQVPRSRGGNKIKFIVVHYLGVPNADNPNLYGGGYGGHYNITRNGTIYKAANPKTAVVWHCGGGLQGSGGHEFYKICTNYNSIGIENSVGYLGSEKSPSGESDKWYFTEETQESLVWLVSKLMDEYNVPIEHLVRHWSVTGKTCPNPYVRNNKTMTSWTWDEFIANVKQYRKDGTITVPDRSSSSTPQKTKSYLSKGDTGDAVKAMQKLLISLGYYCGASGADGDFGTGTETALKAFQKKNGLDVDGFYGNASKAALTKLYDASAIIGSARHNEYGTISGGQPGDQTGEEVVLEPWYLHAKGWVIARAKSEDVRKKLAKCIQDACDNRNIGYDDSSLSRTLYKTAEPFGFDVTKVNTKVSTSCAQLVRVALRYAGVEIGDFFTGNEIDKIKATDQFDILTDDAHCSSGDRLIPGDILVTKTTGHTAICIKGGAKSAEEAKPEPKPVVEDKWYRVRKTWDDAASQLGAFKSLDNAINNCPDGYSVFDNDGKKLYPEASGLPYAVKVTDPSLNFRQGPGVSYPKAGVIKDMGIYTIVEEKNGWGKLKSGAGWINLKYTVRV